MWSAFLTLLMVQLWRECNSAKDVDISKNGTVVSPTRTMPPSGSITGMYSSVHPRLTESAPITVNSKVDKALLTKLSISTAQPIVHNATPSKMDLPVKQPTISMSTTALPLPSTPTKPELSQLDDLNRSIQKDRSKTDNHTKDSLTTVPPIVSTTRRHIYIRGHLLKAHRTRTFHPADPEEEGFFKAPNTVQREYVQNFRDEPHGGKKEQHQDEEVDSEPNIMRFGVPPKRQKKHSNHKSKKFHNYKLLYDTIKNQNALRRRETEFYAWIFGATMLTLGSVTTLTSCLVFCFCGEKWKKRRQTRKFDKSGQYQRVDSVSSIVDYNNGGLPQEYSEEQMDSVTII